MIFDELSKLMNAIETRLWQGPKLLAGLLYLAVLAFAAECLKMIGRFVDSFVSAVTRKPATWHIVTLGELIEIAVFLVGYGVVTFWIYRSAKEIRYLSDGAIQKAKEQLQEAMNLRGEIHQEMETVIEMSRQVTDFIPILDRVGKEVDRLNKQFGADKK